MIEARYERDFKLGDIYITLAKPVELNGKSVSKIVITEELVSDCIEREEQNNLLWLDVVPTNYRKTEEEMRIARRRHVEISRKDIADVRGI